MAATSGPTRPGIQEDELRAGREVDGRPSGALDGDARRRLAHSWLVDRSGRPRAGRREDVERLVAAGRRGCRGRSPRRGRRLRPSRLLHRPSNERLRRVSARGDVLGHRSRRRSRGRRRSTDRGPRRGRVPRRPGEGFPPIESFSPSRSRSFLGSALRRPGFKAPWPRAKCPSFDAFR